MINHELVDTMASSTRMTRRGIVDAFRASTRQDMAKLRTLVRTAAYEQVALQAHRLTGACEMLGAGAAARASRALESAARERTERVDGAFAALECEAQALDAYLETIGGG